MAAITLLDTGYLKIDNSGTQFTAAQRANSGAALTPLSSALSFGMNVVCDTAPNVGFWDETTQLYKLSKIPKTSVNNPTLMWTIRIKKSDSTQMGYISKLLTFARSKGYKILYYNSTSAPDPEKTLIYQLSKYGLYNTAVGTAHVDTGSNFSSAETTYGHIHVRFSGGITISEMPDSGILTMKMPLVMIG